MESARFFLLVGSGGIFKSLPHEHAVLWVCREECSIYRSPRFKDWDNTNGSERERCSQRPQKNALKLYVEYSNETWNGGCKQAHYCHV